jgi:hypothetical protein
MTLGTNNYYYGEFSSLGNKRKCLQFIQRIFLKLPDKFQHVAKTWQGSKTFVLFSLTYSQIWLSSLVDDGLSTYCGWNLLSKYGDFRK